MTSYWFDSQIATSPSLSGAQFADVAIVGGGFAGLSAAQHLKSSEPGLRVALVEAKHIGFGASGRNAGWLLSLPPVHWLLEDLDDPRRLADIRWTSQLCRDNIAQLPIPLIPPCDSERSRHLVPGEAAICSERSDAGVWCFS